MRCIEISSTAPSVPECSAINSNMRCIEMWYYLMMHINVFVINSNMRCIEMIKKHREKRSLDG